MSLIPVPRVISAAGFVTSLGGGSLSETVRAAMDEAAASTWRPDDLQTWAGETIAELDRGRGRVGDGRRRRRA